MKPLIGITPSPMSQSMDHGTFDRYAMTTNYVEGVVAAGGIPVVLPPQDDHVPPLLDVVDGLLLSGGGDLAPNRYGDPSTHPATYGVHPLRDRFEIDLVAAGIARDTPMLCICRGIQVLNVALGGTLVQDIPDQVAGALEHRQHRDGLPADDIGHRVIAEDGSPLAELYGGTTIGVNSFHHQAVGTVAGRLVVTGRAPDGVVEAVTIPDHAFVLGLQWHPEMMFARHAAHLAPFRALVEAACSRRLSRGA